MMNHPTRRRFITISAAVAGLTAIPGAALARSPAHRWRGGAMGADAEMILYHDKPEVAQKLIDACIAEVHRLERIFSLYRSDSAISELNATGTLAHPPPELIGLLSRASAISELTDGAFDITVQSLWRLYSDHFTNGGTPAGPSEAALRATRKLVDYRTVVVRSDLISFSRPNVQITLNGIAQGYITDAVSKILRQAGATNVLVNMGEIRALGAHKDGHPWRVGLGSDALDTYELNDQAIASSEGKGMFFPSTRDHHHLFDPHSGASAHRWQRVSVIAPNATLADALSTAFYSLSDDRIRSISAKSNVQVRAQYKDGIPFNI